MMIFLQVFRPYAKFWLAPLVHFVVCGGAGVEINYFVTDVVVTVLSWHTHAIPEVRQVKDVIWKEFYLCVYCSLDYQCRVII